MAYCTYTDLQNLGAPATVSTAQLTAIIDSADREINIYLSANGVTGSACDALKEASIILSKARILEFRVLSSEIIQSSGELISGSELTAAGSANTAIRLLREQAFRILDNYVASSTGSVSSGITIVPNPDDPWLSLR